MAGGDSGDLDGVLHRYPTRRPTQLDAIRIDGEHAGDFQITDDSTCAPGPINEGTSCTVAVRFAPTQQGERHAMLGILGISGGKGVVLTGTGISASP